MELTAKDLKNFLKNIPDNALVIFGKDNVVCLFNGNSYALNKWGATWENGIGYLPDGTSCCSECSHFQCNICKGYAKGE